MHVSRAKRIVAAVLAAVAGITLVAVLLSAGYVVLNAGSGADPAAAFSEIPVVPESLDELVKWKADGALVREVEPDTRALVESAWVSGWQALATSQLTGSRELVDVWYMPGLAQHVGISAPDGQPATLIQHGHVFEVSFYSLDGSILGVTIDSDLERQFANGPTLRSRERFDVVLLLSDGNWRMQHITLVSGS